MGPQRRGLMRAPMPVAPWASFERPRYFDRYASRNGSSQNWQNKDVQYGPRSNWQRPNASNNSQYRPSSQQSLPPGSYGRFPNPHQFHRGPRTFRGQNRPPYLVQRPDYYPNDNTFKEVEPPSKTSDPIEKPFDKTLNDAIDTVKRKLRERKLSDNLEHSDNIFSPTETEVSSKATEKKRIEHTKVSPKAVSIKKNDKKEDVASKHKNCNTTSKSAVSKKSQVLRKKILHQLFKMGSNNLRQIVSNPESSDKYNFVLTSLIKDRKKALSKELRSVAEKSLQYHNISADSARGEQIMQDAFLGHLGTMLDTNASIELFNMEPQLIKELSNVLQQDLIYSSNDEDAAIKIANVMHEDFYEENDYDPVNLNTDYFNTLETKFDPNNIDGQPFVSGNAEINHMVMKFILDSQNDKHINLPLHPAPLLPPPPPPPIILPPPTPSQTLSSQQEVVDTSGLRLVNLSSLMSVKTEQPDEIRSEPFEIKNNETHSQEIIKNFDLALGKYEISTKNAKNNKSKFSQKKSHLNKINNLTDKDGNKHQKTVELKTHDEVSFPTVEGSISPKKSGYDHKTFNEVEASHSPKKSRNDHKVPNELNFLTSVNHSFNKSKIDQRFECKLTNEAHNLICEASSSPKKSRYEHKMSNELNFPIGEVSLVAKKIRYDHKETKSNFPEMVFKNNIFDADRPNFVHSDRAASNDSKSSSMEVDQNLKNNKFNNNKNQYLTTSNVSNLKRPFRQENHGKNVQNNLCKDSSETLLHKNDKLGRGNFNHTISKRSRRNKHRHKSKSFNNNETSIEPVQLANDRLVSAEKKSLLEISDISNIKIEPQQPSVVLDISNIKVEAQPADDTKRCENCLNREKTQTKSQGTQYYDFGKIHASTQVYASLITSKSKGSQCSKLNCKDIGNQTNKVFDSSLNAFTTLTIKDSTDFSCQVDLNPIKETCNAEINTINVPYLDYINEEVTSQSDVIDRMKKIDNDIHLLLQEKFRLYNIIGTKIDNKQSSSKKIKDMCKPKMKSKTTSTPINKLRKKSSLIKPVSPKKEEHSEVMKIKKFYSIDANGELTVHNNMHDMEFLSTNRTPEDYAVNYVDMSGKEIASGMDIVSEEVVINDETAKPSTSDDNSTSKIKKAKSKSDAKNRNSKLNIYKSMKNIKKYNLRSCSVILNKMNNNQVQDFVEEFNNHNMNNSSDAFHHDFHDYGDGDYSLSIDSLNSMHFNNFADPDIPTMLENIGGSETVNLIDNWDSKLFDNITLSEGLDVLNKGDEPEVQVPTESAISWENQVKNPIVMSDHTDSIIALQCVGKNILAASLDGNIYYYCGQKGKLLRTIACSGLAVTSLWAQSDTFVVYAGSLDSNLRCFDYERGVEIFDAVNIGSAIQSMCHAWDTLYVGTRTGFVIQFDTKSNTVIEDSTIKFSEQAILALEAIKEGPRKVLLIASRSQDVTVKDAKTGLLLRSFRGPNTTVYSLLFDSGNIYCGTSGSDVQVFNFVTGDLIGLHSGGNGAVCLQMYRGLLFVGCYDGIIYVFKPGVQQPLASIPGSGTMLLAMTITDNMIIGGCKDKSLSIWTIPHKILNEMI